MVTIDIDITDDEYVTQAMEKFNIDIELTQHGARVTGLRDDIMGYLRSDLHGLDYTDVEGLFPELMDNSGYY